MRENPPTHTPCLFSGACPLRKMIGHTTVWGAVMYRLPAGGSDQAPGSTIADFSPCFLQNLFPFQMRSGLNNNLKISPNADRETKDSDALFFFGGGQKTQNA